MLQELLPVTDKHFIFSVLCSFGVVSRFCTYIAVNGKLQKNLPKLPLESPMDIYLI